jgi:tetratricopeptide (TPR) repeat protein
MRSLRTKRIGGFPSIKMTVKFYDMSNILLIWKKFMIKKSNLYVCLISLLFLLTNCGQIIKSEQGTVQNLLGKARKNITTAESFSDIKRKSDLLKTAQAQLNEAQAIAKIQKSMENEIASGYAYYYFASGEYGLAKKFAENITDKNDQFGLVLNTRILLKEKGKDFAKNATAILEPVLNANPRYAMARLTLGDCNFLLGNFQEAQKQYTEVLKIGEAFQFQAADRLEVLDQIRRTGIDTSKVQNIILSISLRRDETAYLLMHIFNADKYLKFGKTGEKNFMDITDSFYADSILALREKGFFSFINSENFEPNKIVTRGEVAKMIEDFFVLQSGNTALRAKFSKDARSSIRGLDTKDTYYNAIKTAIEAKAMVISLDGSINPLEPISGLETIDAFSKLMK